MYGYPWFNYGYPERYAGKIIDIHNWIVGVNIWLDYGYPYCRGSYILKLNCGCPIIWIMDTYAFIIKLWIGVIRHHYTYPWLSIIMDAHDRSQQNTWKLFETLSVLMSYRKYNTIILDCLSKLRIMDLLRCDTMTNGVKKIRSHWWKFD